MKRIFSLRSWLRLDRIFDGLVAFKTNAISWLCACLKRLSLTTIQRRTPRRPSYRPQIEGLEVRVVPTVGTLAFANTAPNVLEDGDYITITVVRTGSLSEAASVDVASSDVTAEAGDDYTAVSTTLNFAANDSEKTFNVPILDDSPREFSETLSLRLSNAVNASIHSTDGVATLTILDPEDNTAPEAINDSYTLHQGDILDIPDGALGLLGNDTDPEHDLLLIAELNGDPVAFNEEIELPSGATLILQEDGTFIYVPVAGDTTSDSFTYTVSDGALEDEATVTIDLTKTAPVAGDESYQVLENQTLTISTSLTGVLGNDSDADSDTLTITQVNGSAVNFDQALTLTSGASLTPHANGILSYAPASNWTGNDSFTYTISDGAETDTATVSLVVAANPLAVNDDVAGMDEDAEDVVIAVLANDQVASGGTLALDSVDTPAGCSRPGIRDFRGKRDFLTVVLDELGVGP